MDEETVVINFADMRLPTKEEIKASIKPRLPKPINEYTYDGIFVETHNSIREAADKHGISTDRVYNCAVGVSLKCTVIERIFLYRGDDIEKRLAAIEEAQKKWKTGQDKKIDEYDLRGRFLFTYPTQKLAAMVTKVSSIAIGQCCRGEKPYIGKRIFLEHGDDIKKRMPAVKEALLWEKNRRKKCKPVDQYTLDGQYIKGYPSASAASRATGISISVITRCCHGVDGRGYPLYKLSDKIFLFTGDSITERLELIKNKQNKKS